MCLKYIFCYIIQKQLSKKQIEKIIINQDIEIIIKFLKTLILAKVIKAKLIFLDH